MSEIIMLNPFMNREIFDQLVAKTAQIMVKKPGLTSARAANEAIGQRAGARNPMPTDPFRRKRLRDAIAESLEG